MNLLLLVILNFFIVDNPKWMSMGESVYDICLCLCNQWLEKALQC